MINQKKGRVIEFIYLLFKKRQKNGCPIYGFQKKFLKWFLYIFIMMVTISLFYWFFFFTKYLCFPSKKKNPLIFRLTITWPPWIWIPYPSAFMPPNCFPLNAYNAFKRFEVKHRAWSERERIPPTIGIISWKDHTVKVFYQAKETLLIPNEYPIKNVFYT